MQFLGFQLLQLKGELRRVRLVLNINRLYLAHYQQPLPLPKVLSLNENCSCSCCEFPLSYLIHSHHSSHLQATEASSTDFSSNFTLVQLHWNFSSDFPIRATNAAHWGWNLYFCSWACSSSRFCFLKYLNNHYICPIFPTQTLLSSSSPFTWATEAFYPDFLPSLIYLESVPQSLWKHWFKNTIFNDSHLLRTLDWLFIRLEKWRHNSSDNSQ